MRITKRLLEALQHFRRVEIRGPYPALVKPVPETPPPPPPHVESGMRFTVPAASTSVGARCLCCQSNNVTLHDNGSARWVQCHNPHCGMSHFVSMHPELAPFFPRRDTWPKKCELCNHDMTSADDRTEWHGLGNCVPICPTCSGSGTAEEILHMQKPETVFDAARQLIQKRAELIELEKEVDSHYHEEFTTCEKCERYPTVKSEYERFALDWVNQFALFAGGMRAKRTAEGGCATQTEGGAA